MAGSVRVCVFMWWLSGVRFAAGAEAASAEAASAEAALAAAAAAAREAVPVVGEALLRVKWSLNSCIDASGATTPGSNGRALGNARRNEKPRGDHNARRNEKPRGDLNACGNDKPSGDNNARGNEKPRGDDNAPRNDNVRGDDRILSNNPCGTRRCNYALRCDVSLGDGHAVGNDNARRNDNARGDDNILSNNLCGNGNAFEKDKINYGNGKAPDSDNVNGNANVFGNDNTRRKDNVLGNNAYDNEGVVRIVGSNVAYGNDVFGDDNSRKSDALGIDYAGVSASDRNIFYKVKDKEGDHSTSNREGNVFDACENDNANMQGDGHGDESHDNGNESENYEWVDNALGDNHDNGSENYRSADNEKGSEGYFSVDNGTGSENYITGDYRQEPPLTGSESYITAENSYGNGDAQDNESEDKMASAASKMASPARRSRIGAPTSPPVKKYICPICHRDFPWLCEYKAHLHAHKDTMVYRCRQCEFVTAHAHALTEHRLTHAREQPVLCRACGARFPAMRLLIRHINSAHGY